jgi:hypothetical protein
VSSLDPGPTIGFQTPLLMMSVSFW